MYDNIDYGLSVIFSIQVLELKEQYFPPTKTVHNKCQWVELAKVKLMVYNKSRSACLQVVINHIGQNEWVISLYTRSQSLGRKRSTHLQMTKVRHHLSPFIKKTMWTHRSGQILSTTVWSSHVTNHGDQHYWFINNTSPIVSNSAMVYIWWKVGQFSNVLAFQESGWEDWYLFIPFIIAIIECYTSLVVIFLFLFTCIFASF